MWNTPTISLLQHDQLIISDCFLFEFPCKTATLLSFIIPHTMFILKIYRITFSFSRCGFRTDVLGASRVANWPDPWRKIQSCLIITPKPFSLIPVPRLQFLLQQARTTDLKFTNHLPQTTSSRCLTWIGWGKCCAPGRRIHPSLHLQSRLYLLTSLERSLGEAGPRNHLEVIQSQQIRWQDQSLPYPSASGMSVLRLAPIQRHLEASQGNLSVTLIRVGIHLFPWTRSFLHILDRAAGREVCTDRDKLLCSTLRLPLETSLTWSTALLSSPTWPTSDYNCQGFFFFFTNWKWLIS